MRNDAYWGKDLAQGHGQGQSQGSCLATYFYSEHYNLSVPKANIQRLSKRIFDWLAMPPGCAPCPCLRVITWDLDFIQI